MKINAKDALKVNADGIREAVSASLDAAVAAGKVTREEQADMTEAVTNFMLRVGEAQVEGCEQFEDSDKGLPITFLMASNTLLGIMVKQTDAVLNGLMFNALFDEDATPQ